MSELKLYDIESAEAFFKTATLPNGCVMLEPGAKIVNLKKFVDAHLSVVRNNSNKAVFMPYYERLIKLASILKRNNPDDILPPAVEKVQIAKKVILPAKSGRKKK